MLYIQLLSVQKYHLHKRKKMILQNKYSHT